MTKDAFTERLSCKKSSSCIDYKSWTIGMKNPLNPIVKTDVTGYMCLANTYHNGGVNTCNKISKIGANLDKLIQTTKTTYTLNLTKFIYF